jgi:tetraacyldisaccharide 4'-kinase
MDSPPSFRERLVRDWYLPRLTLLTAALSPLSWLFRGIAGARRALYRSGLLRPALLPVPVIVVGNITAGGTGKTPLAAWLVRALRARGMHPGIVSRGHDGANTTPRAVCDGDDPRATGDEPLLLARTGSPVWIGRDRVAAARGLLGSHPEVDVIVSDDGLQHYRLPRAVEIVVVDGQRGFGNGALLPAGPLREPLARANTVDAIVVNGAALNPVPMLAIGVPTFAMRLSGERFRSLVEAERSVGAEAFGGQRMYAIAGIGNPERFFGSLRALGLDPICRAFPDHHAYTAQELAFPDADAILMTDKDAIKCQALADARMWTLPVEAIVAPGLIERILEKMHGRQAA